MTRKIPWYPAVVLAAIVSLASASVSAQQLSQSTLTDAEIDQRLRFLEQRLDDSRTHGQIWHWSWLTVNGGSAVANTALAAGTGDHDDTVSYSVQAARATIGTVNMLLDPLEARHGADNIRDLPESNREEKLAKLRLAEDQLKRNAERTDTRYDWKQYAGNAFINAAAGGIIAGLAEEGEAFQVGISGFIGGLAMLWTEPWNPNNDWEDYQKLSGGKTSAIDVDVMVATRPDGGGLAVRLSWCRVGHIEPTEAMRAPAAHRGLRLPLMRASARSPVEVIGRSGDIHRAAESRGREAKALAAFRTVD